MSTETEMKLREALMMAQKHLRYAVVRYNGYTLKSDVVGTFDSKRNAEEWLNNKRIRHASNEVWYGYHGDEYSIKSYFAF